MFVVRQPVVKWIRVVLASHLVWTPFGHQNVGKFWVLMVQAPLLVHWIPVWMEIILLLIPVGEVILLLPMNAGSMFWATTQPFPWTIMATVPTPLAPWLGLLLMILLVLLLAPCGLPPMPLIRVQMPASTTTSFSASSGLPIRMATPKPSLMCQM